MYWRQVIAAAVVALGAMAFVLDQGVSLLRTFAAGVLAYTVASVVLATIGRTRYWYSLGTRGAKRWHCKGCGRRIYRKGGDWVLTCHRCGWRAGYPGLRWFTHSVPVNQFRRSVSALHVLTVIVAFVVLVSSLPVLMSGGGGEHPVVNTNRTSVPESSPTSTLTPTPSPSPQPTPEPGTQGYNLSRVETVFIELLNDERTGRGLQPVTQRDELTEMGRGHSRNMAEHDYLGHDEPGPGGTIEDRYRNRGLLPECQLPIGDSDRYYPGAENAAHFWVEERVIQENGSIYVDSERDLARGLFTGWMNSPPHRRAMLVASADEAGLGLWIDDRGKVYASLELC